MKALMKIAILACTMAMSAFTCFANESAEPRRQKVGLVLSGGGSKGIAHIGVIKVLEENNIPIDYVAGTSMGAIVGGLYAAGYSPEEMLDLITSKPFAYWSTGQIDPNYVYYFATETPSPAMLTVPINSKRDSIERIKSAVPASLISPMPMSFAFMELFSKQTAQSGGNFDKLFVPYRCVASDVKAKHKVVLQDGSLGDAIRASMSFPLVFQPTQIDTILLYDGGLYDNFPVDVMVETFHPDIIIGVNVSVPEIGPQTSLMDQLENLVIQARDNDLAPDLGIKLSIDLNEFSLLDFPKADQIYQIGYEHAENMIDSIKGRVTDRVPMAQVAKRRKAFKKDAPELTFSSVSVEGGTPQQNRYLEYLFNSKGADTISLAEAHRAFYRAISPGKLRAFTPQSTFDDSTGMFRLNLKASVKDDFKLGVGGYITSSTSSYIFLSAGYSKLSFSSLSTGVGAWIGQSYLGAVLNSRLYLRTPLPSALELEGVAFRQKYFETDYLFFEDKSPSYVLDHQYFGRLKWACAIGSLCNMEAGVGYGYINDSFYQPDLSLGYSSVRDHSRYSLAQAFLKFETNTLNDINYPIQGNHFRATAMAVTGSHTRQHGSRRASEVKTSPQWLQIEGVARSYMPLGRHFALGIEGDVMLSTRKLLNDYYATIVAAPAFLPTPSSSNFFNSAFRSNSFIAAGLVPIYKYNTNLSARLQTYCFLPVRKIDENVHGEAYYSGWFKDPQFFGELDVCYKLPFATVTAYCNYASSPAHNWNVGISFGIFLHAPQFLR